MTSFLTSVPHAAHTVRGYNRLVNGGVNGTGPAAHLADKYADSLTRADLESVRERMRAMGNTVHTINLNVGRLKAALNWAASESLITRNPWRDFRSLPGASHVTRAATLEQVQAVYQHLPEWMQWAVRTAMALCLRPGISELFSLEWSAFDFRRGNVTVYMPKVARKKVVFAPVPYLKEAEARHQASPSQAMVCPGPTGRRITSPSSYKRLWKRACKDAGESFPMYAIRHVAASEMLTGGADIAAVAAQLGHRDITTTGQFYIHAIPGAQRHAATMLPMSGLVAMVGNGAADKAVTQS